MNLFQRLTIFRNDEHGAVTVDWVVLTATIVGLGVVVTTLITEGMEQQSNAIDAQLEEEIVVTTFPGADEE